MGVKGQESEANRIFKIIDLDHNGILEFSEWATVTMDKNKMLSKKRLEQAFAIFDNDGSGEISYKELEDLLIGESKDE